MVQHWKDSEAESGLVMARAFVLCNQSYAKYALYVWVLKDMFYTSAIHVLLNSTFMIVLLSFLFNFVLKNVIAHEIQHVAMLLRCFDT